MTNVYMVLLQLQKRIAMLNDTLASLMNEIANSGVVLLSLDETKSEHPEATSPRALLNQLKSESSDILYAASDLMHVRCGKLLTLRADQNAQLNFKDFFKLFDITWRFVSVGEQICQRSCIGLRGTILTQVFLFSSLNAVGKIVY